LAVLVRTIYWIVIATCVAPLSFGSTAFAQGLTSKFEITPFAAVRTGGQFEQIDGDLEFDLDESSAYGIILNGYVRDNTQWEFFYSKQDTIVDTQGLFVSDPLADIGVEYIQLGGTYLFDGSTARPFIAMTFGMSRFDPEPAEFAAENFFSGTFGAGVQLLTNKRMGLRLEIRGMATLVDDNNSIFCQSGNGAALCLIEIDGTILMQWEARAGLIFRF